MPSEIYGTLYNQNDLNTVITMVKDICAKKPESANPPTVTGGATAPFTLIKAPNGNSKKIHFQEGECLSDRIDKLTETLYQMDMKESPPGNLISPLLLVLGVEVEEVDLDPGEIAQIGIEEKDGLGQKANFEEEEDSPVEENSKEESLTRAPLLEDPVYRADPKTKIRTDVIIVINEAILRLSALIIIKNKLKRHPRERSLKTIRMPMEVLTNPS